MLADIEAKEGAVGILCNNAGITRDALLLRMKQDDWDCVLQTNLTSVFRLSKGVLRGMMKARKGRIISITSVVGLTGNPGQANYAAATAGIIGFTKSLAREVGSRGITANAIAPGFIDTEMSLGPDGVSELETEWFRANYVEGNHLPLRRAGRPEEIAGVAAFLAGPDATYLTGQVITVDGGLTITF